MLIRPIFLALFAVAALAGSASADATFPNRPNRILVPYPPSGVVDTAMRRLADLLSKRWGSPSFRIIVQVGRPSPPPSPC
jgi:tripartite-type tricarboxylate transporter receptor subunit TctC